MGTLERAIALAAAAHAGQTDKAGAPYITHPLRVMARVSGDTKQIVAVLHDVVEDTIVTAQWLRELGFTQEVMEAVEAVTKRPEEEGDERYFDFVSRAAEHDLARDVKRADLIDNMDLTRIAKVEEKDQSRMARYRLALKLLEAIGRYRGDVMPTAPTIIPLTNRVTAAEVERECPWQAPIFACDFAVEGAEDKGNAGGLELGRILNVDHHADVPRMQQPVTSTQLARDYLMTHPGPIARGSWVVINHTDCDSVLSSAMLMGLISPDEQFVTASRCADHTGAENAIADLLQALDESREGTRTEEQYLESLRNLALLLANKPLEPAAEAFVALRMARRNAAKQFVDARAFKTEDAVVMAITDEAYDGAFFVPLLPRAAVIMTARPHSTNTQRWIVKLRLGTAAPPGLTLHALGVTEWDSNFGGRWNAGGNKRPPARGAEGGTDTAPDDYLATLRSALERWHATHASEGAAEECA